ncbi:MAG: hypothetical protein ACREQA_20735 [Candidatus Binatia bacterium]
MARRTLIVHRKGFTVPRTRFKRDGTTIDRESFRVPPTTFRIEDRGAPGRGKPIIPQLKKGRMTRAAIEGGYIQAGQKVTDIPDSRMDDFARYLVGRVGARDAFGMFQAQVVFRKRQRSPEARKFEIGRDTIAREFGEELKPTEAIRANLRRGQNPSGPG